MLSNLFTVRQNQRYEIKIKMKIKEYDIEIKINIKDIDIK
jgi:hypothetical protein